MILCWEGRRDIRQRLGLDESESDNARYKAKLLVR